MPWDSRLGGARIWMELEAQWRAAGHHVEHFSLSDAFPATQTSRAGFALRQGRFGRRAADYVRRNAGRFDVIDALIGSLHDSKQRLRFNGLLVARSIGLNQLYEEFERSVRQEHKKRGSIPGRFLYSVLRRQSLRASDRSIAHADLINVPNTTEAGYLRNAVGVSKPIVVQPYGLTTELRRAFADAAAPAAKKLAKPIVCFVGMWSARKGTREWPHIVERVLQAVPTARFRFLGTMVDDEAIARDMHGTNRDIYENVSTFMPVDLPHLLRDCAVGAFPSYVEGFGLAVLEQLAAKIPTVAYDVAGPRDILHALPEQLVPAGDHARFADAIVALLQNKTGPYESLAQRSAAAAAEFDWATIATDTLREYQDAIARHSTDVLFVQPFGLSSPGGGARILRMLVGNAPLTWRSACTSPQRPPKFTGEVHLATRPGWGKIEHSRLAMFPALTAGLFRDRFRKRLLSLCGRQRVRSIHAVAHFGLDFAIANDVARELELPFFLSVHDDVAYTAQHVRSALRESAIKRAWDDAAARFVISDALGREYARRYGQRLYVVVTDGVTHVAAAPIPPNGETLRVYFMGLFHMAYEQNLRALLDGLAAFAQRTGRAVTMICRCEHIRPQVLHGSVDVQVLPFAGEAQVERDIAGADLLYMPIPFGEAHANFARYSLSTKMVTYLGSGVPILYHGPTDSAAFDLLTKHDATLAITSLDVDAIADAVLNADAPRLETIASNALRLARDQFTLAEQRARFWGAIQTELATV